MQSLISVVSSSEAPGETAIQRGNSLSLKANNISLELSKQVKQHKQGELCQFLGSISKNRRELDQALIEQYRILKSSPWLWSYDILKHIHDEKFITKPPLHTEHTVQHDANCNLPKCLSRYVSGPDPAANPATYPKHVYESSTQTLTSIDEINAQAISYALQLCSLSVHW